MIAFSSAYSPLEDEPVVDTSSPFTHADAARVWQKLDDLTKDSSQTSERITALEAICAERHSEILRSQERMAGLLKWIVGAIAALVLAQLGGINPVELARAISGIPVR